MKALFTFLALGAVMLAQTPAPKKSTAASKSLTNPASLNAQAPASFKAKFTTTKGDFVVEVTRALAPLGADRFYNLVKNGFFDGATFFRVLPGFVVQFGLPANPAVGRAWANAKIKDDPVRTSNIMGSIVFATAGPGTRTTQLFINLGNNARLDSDGFAPFGRVIEGMPVVSSFYSGYGERPDQGAITSQGKAYLDKSFPKLDSIQTASILSEEAAPAKAAPKK